MIIYDNLRVLFIMVINATLISFATGSHKNFQSILSKWAKNKFKKIISYTDQDIHHTEFSIKNKELLNAPRGFGYWCWKPYLILHTLEFTDCPAVLYCDSNTIFIDFNKFKTFFISHMDKNDFLIGFDPRNNLQKAHTKRDCFVKCHCDSPEY